MSFSSGFNRWRRSSTENRLPSFNWCYSRQVTERCRICVFVHLNSWPKNSHRQVAEPMATQKNRANAGKRRRAPGRASESWGFPALCWGTRTNLLALRLNAIAEARDYDLELGHNSQLFSSVTVGFLYAERLNFRLPWEGDWTSKILFFNQVNTDWNTYKFFK